MAREPGNKKDHMSNLSQRAAARKVTHYCRNSHCRSRLPHPVENERRAFCARGCHSIFYRSRCLVCEEPMRRKGDHQRFGSGHSRCKAEYRRYPHVYDWPEGAKPTQTGQGTASVREGGRNADFTGLKTRDLPDRPRPKSVGPKMSATSYCLARLPLDPAMAAKLERANAVVASASEALTVSDVAMRSRWEPTGDGKDMPALPAFLVRR